MPTGKRITSETATSLCYVVKRACKLGGTGTNLKSLIQRCDPRRFDALEILLLVQPKHMKVKQLLVTYPPEHKCSKHWGGAIQWYSSTLIIRGHSFRSNVYIK